MMTKIFGAALIVSGGYLIGSIRVRQKKCRMEILLEIHGLLEHYFSELKEYRSSIDESFSGRGILADRLLAGQFPKGLLNEDRQMLTSLFQQLKVGSYKQSITVTEEALQRLQSTANKLKEEAASQGKALPLVTGAIGFLIAVLLF